MVFSGTVFSTVLMCVFLASCAQSAPCPPSTMENAPTRRTMTSGRRPSLTKGIKAGKHHRRLAGMQDLEHSRDIKDSFHRASVYETSSTQQGLLSESNFGPQHDQDLVQDQSNSSTPETGLLNPEKRHRSRQRKEQRSEVESLHRNEKELETDQVSEAGNVEHALEDETRRKVLTSKVVSLLQHHHELERLLASLGDASTKISKDFEESLHRRNELSQATETARRSRLLVERDLDYFKRHSILQDESLNHLKSQVSGATSLMNKLKERYYNSLKAEAHLKEEFRDHGLEHWVESSMRQRLNPVILDAIMQGTEYVVEPMLDGIEKLANVNDEIADTVSRRLRNRISMAQKPFYSGFVSYTVLLCPLVMVISVLTKLRRGFSRLSSMHFIVLMSFYYAMLTFGCLSAILVGSVDVLKTFRRNHFHLFNFLLVLHSLAYILLVALHLLRSVLLRSIDGFGHFLMLAAIGAHFINVAKRQALANQSLRVDPWVYLVYSAVFCFVLFELIFKNNPTLSKVNTDGRLRTVAAIHAHTNGETRPHAISRPRVAE